MTERSTHHDTFIIERDIDAPANLVFFAWANAEAKTQWFAAPTDKWQLLERHLDFREGGTERLKGRWQSGTVTDFTCEYRDIVPDQRIVYSYDMHHNDKRLSCSLATIEFTPNGQGTHLKLTEQIVHFDGYPTPEDRKTGTEALIDMAIAFVISQKADA